MNKYRVTIPYSYLRYGKLYADVYAESYDEAEDLACDGINRYNEDYDDGDDDGDTDYDYSGIDSELLEEDVPGPDNNFRPHHPEHELVIPSRFIKDIVLL